MQKKDTWFGKFYTAGKVYYYTGKVDGRRNPSSRVKSGSIVGYPYWYGPGLASTAVILNVFRGIPLLIANHDSRAEDVCIYILGNLPYQPDESSVFADMASRGWYPEVSSGKAYGTLMLDSKRRCRMVAMQYLRKLKSRKAIPDIEKLLKSTQSDEREYALATLEDIAKGGADTGTSGTAKVSEEDKYDTLVMRNGNKMSGQIQNASLNLKTSYATMKFSTSKISYIKMEGADSQLEKLELRNGDKLSGNLSDEVFTVKLQSGGTIAVKKKDIASITFRCIWAKDEKAPATRKPSTK